VATALDVGADWPFPAFTAMVDAVLADADTEKETGEPVSPDEVAVAVLVPTIVPSVHPPTVAMPLAFVVCVVLVIEPPPPVTAKVTDTPATGFPAASRTITAGFEATTAPTVPVVLPA
jgi:hypothetical protein